MAIPLCSSLITTFGFIMAAVGMILGFYVFPNVINRKIDDSVKLVNGSDAYKRWETIPIPLQFKVYFFNVTNPDEVQLGAKPKVVEIGPYIYNEMRHKHDIVKDDDTLSYYQDQIFVFNEEASKPNKQDDIITVAHLPLMVFMTMVEAMQPKLVKRLNPHIDTLFYEPKNLFLTTTVKKFLFDGIHMACDKAEDILMIKIICDLTKRNAPMQLEALKDGRLKFSLLSYKNNTNDGYYKTNAGTKDINFLGEILAWNNASVLEKWEQNSNCDKIYGTDTTIFPPHRDEFSNIQVFQSDICRSINLHYDTDTVYKDIEGLRFVVERDVFASGANYSANECFCLNKTKGITTTDGCLYDGALEMWKCHNAPIVLTPPHFYLTHEIYQNTVDGLHPDRSLHEIFIDLEPKSGTILRGSKRIQFNIFYRKIEDLYLTANLRDTLMPILWIDEGVELDDESITLLKDSLFYPMKILKGVYWTLIALGMIIGFIGLIWCMIFAHKPKELF